MLVLSDFLDTVFFQPTPALPPLEPTFDVGRFVYAGSTAEEVAEDVRAAAQRPTKRQKVVDLRNDVNEGEREAGHNNCLDYSSPASAAQEGGSGAEAVSENAPGSLLADVQVEGTTASQRQSAEEYAKSQASQLVMSLAQEQPEFKKIKQEVFALRSRASIGNGRSFNGRYDEYPWCAILFSSRGLQPDYCSRLDAQRLRSRFRRSGVRARARNRSSRPEHFQLGAGSETLPAAAAAALRHDAEGEAFPKPHVENLSRSLEHDLVGQLGCLWKWSRSLWRAHRRDRNASRLEAVGSEKGVACWWDCGRKPLGLLVPLVLCFA